MLLWSRRVFCYLSTTPVEETLRDGVVVGCLIFQQQHCATRSILFIAVVGMHSQDDYQYRYHNEW